MVVTSDRLVDAIYELSNFTPALRTEFWDKDVLPKLLEALVGDIKLRNEMSATFAAIRDLAIVINENGALVKSSMGSKRAIEIAKKRIPEALERLNNTAIVVKGMQSAALKLFEEHGKDILSCVGSSTINKAADDVRARETEKDAAWEKLRQLSQGYGKAKSVVQALDNLLSAIDVRRHGHEAAATAARQRERELADMISAGERELNAIPMTKENTRSSSILFGLFRSVHTYMVDNPNRDAQRDYINSVILVRERRIKEQQETTEGQRDMQMALAKEAAGLEGRREEARKVLESAAERWTTESPKLKAVIVKLDDEIAEIRRNADKAASTLNLRGSALIDCINACKGLSYSEKGQAESHQPLLGIISGIVNRVQSSVDMLAGSDEDVFTAGARMLVMVGSMQQTSIKLAKLVADVHGYNQHAVAIEMKVKNLSIKQQSEEK